MGPAETPAERGLHPLHFAYKSGDYIIGAPEPVKSNIGLTPPLGFPTKASKV